MELTQEHFDEKLAKLYTFLETKVALKDDLTEMRAALPNKTDFHQLQQSVDGIAKNHLDYAQEFSALREQVATMKRWIEHAAAKIDVEYKP